MEKVYGTLSLREAATAGSLLGDEPPHRVYMMTL